MYSSCVSIIMTQIEAGENTPQWMNHLLFKCENQISELPNPHKIWVSMAIGCNPNIRESEIEDLLLNWLVK